MRLKCTPDNFYSFTEPKGECLNWTRCVGNHGYGVVKWQGATTSTHRISYELSHGDIPKGMHVCHTCDNKLCVNPSHLFLGTCFDNMQDKKAKGRHHNSMKSVCKRGHSLSEALVYDGRRYCRECRRILARLKPPTQRKKH